MKVRLSVEVVSDDDALRLLDDLLRLFEDGRHQWVIDDIEGIESSKWVEQARGRHLARILELLHKTITERAYGEATHAIEIVIGSGVGQMNPMAARVALTRPAYLVVEDAMSDGRFLRALLRAYDHSSLETALREQWLEIDHAGGVGGIPRRVDTLIRERAADPRRIQALADSDRLHPDHESDTVKKMRVLEQEHGVTVHVLHKRDSENYLPVDAIAHHKHFRNKAYRAFLELDDVQKDYFDMKSGFSRGTKDTPVIDPVQDGLFGDLRPAIRRDLADGFGAECGGWFEDEDGTVPHYINRSTMESRCSTKPGELPAILAKIEEML